LEEIKKVRGGGSLADGSLAADKPLAQVRLCWRCVAATLGERLASPSSSAAAMHTHTLAAPATSQMISMQTTDTPTRPPPRVSIRNQKHQILAENKARKQAEFEERLAVMKQGGCVTR
jgi:hypothetical protein